MEPVCVRASVLPDGAGKAAVEAGEVNADDRVGLAFQRELEELAEQPAKLEIILQRFGQADHRMRRHVKGQVHSGGSHLWSAGAEKPRLQAGVQRLVIRGWNRFRIGHFPPQGEHEFRRQHVAAGFARNQHEASWFHELCQPLWVERCAASGASPLRREMGRLDSAAVNRGNAVSRTR